MAVINTNSLSLVAQNNLNKSQSALGTAIERLSSGYRINSAKDDAAGQAIANRFTANIKGLTQAARNANDGISIAQTTEGALNEINNNLQRVRELTVQATNGTNSPSDLSSIQDEIKQRLSEIDRVSQQTQFNGVSVLAKDNTLKIQVGANDDETISINLKQIDSSTLNLSTFNVSGPSGTPTTPTAAQFKAAFGENAVVAKATATFTGAAAAKAAFGMSSAGSSVAVGTGVLADKNGNFFAAVTLTADSDADVANLALRGIEVTKGAAKTLYIAVDPSDSTLNAAKTTATFSIKSTDITATTLKSQATASPLAALDDALKTVDSLRSELGAIQNRFESTVTNLNNTITNLTSARSRIEDADVATEVSNMSKNQILQQAGTAVLAQANQVPQTVLSLLR